MLPQEMIDFQYLCIIVKSDVIWFRCWFRHHAVIKTKNQEMKCSAIFKKIRHVICCSVFWRNMIFKPLYGLYLMLKQIIFLCLASSYPSTDKFNNISQEFSFYRIQFLLIKFSSYFIANWARLKNSSWIHFWLSSLFV